MQTTVNTMKQASHYLLLCILISVSLTACHDDIEDFGDTTTTQITQVDVQELTQSDVAGYIYDEAGSAMADVEVNVLGATTRTNDYGVFTFRNIDLDKNGTYVTATKSGYILGSDRIYPKDADVNYSYIKMMQLTSNTSVNATTGGNIVVQGGGIISFPPNAIVNSDGASYSGSVTVTAKRIASDDTDLADVMPGGLLATDKDGYTRVLGTLGMVAVELRDANGNELNLADGMQATVQFPIAESQQETAPEQVALWSFDESQGLWIEEGFATREDNKYVGEVSHFSFWNCDAPFPLIHVCGTVINADGLPGANLQVQIVANVIYPVGYGYTDSDGRFCGKMPKGEELTITIFYPGCQEGGYTFTVGPFDTDTELDPVTLGNEDNGVISGTVYCDGDPISDASVVISIAEQTLVFLTNSEGMYSLNTSIFGCNQPFSGTIFAFNNETSEASVTEQFEVFADASIDLNTCGACDMIISAITGYNDDPCLREFYFAAVDVTEANGTVSYLWSNGSAEQSINNLLNGTYCVTVTDDEGCQEISCIEFEFFELADSLVVVNSTCLLDNGSIESNPFGGTAPYTQTISSGGNVISTSANAENLGPGVYIVEVTDDNGCVVITTQEIIEAGGIPEFEIIEECGVTQLWLSPNLGDFIISLDGIEYTNFVQVYETGEYCFIITDSQGCMETRCIDVFVQDQLTYAVNTTCNFPYYTLDWDVEVFNAYYLGTGNPEALTTLASPTSFDVNPIIYGYSGTIVLDQDFQMCTYEEFIVLPNFEGLSATGVSPSCADCDDGYIEVVLDADADCNTCNLGEVAIYNSEDDLMFDNNLITINDSQEMGSGQYYVVVTDQDSGCIIAHQIIEL